MSWGALKTALGLAEGGALRSALDRLLPGAGSKANGSAADTVGFTIAVISLAAKLAKSDGVASDIEAHTFELIFRASDAEVRNVRRIYDLAKRDAAGFEAYALQIARMLDDEPDVKRDVLDSLFAIAAADGIFHGNEEVYLKDVARSFGYSDAGYRRVRALFVRDDDDPYTILGVAHDTGDDALKQRHRELVREHHPDRMIARGVPPEFVVVADRKLAAINAAFDRIAKERGL